MDYNIKDLYASTMLALIYDFWNVLHPTMTYSEHYGVTIARTTNFTILWDGIDSMTMLAIYDWNTQIALDLSANAANADDFVNGKIKFIIESFFWFADKVISVPQEVLSCRE